jgi:hypothetical protein
MSKLQEYVDLVLPRAGVEDVAGRLRVLLSGPPLDPAPGSAAWLVRELERALDRDRSRVAAARIQTAVGELTVDELLEAASIVLELDRNGGLDTGDRRTALAEAFERAVSVASLDGSDGT